MDDRSTDIFEPLKENNYESIKDEEEPEEEQEKEGVSNIFEEERGKGMIRGACYAKKWGIISKNST